MTTDFVLYMCRETLLTGVYILGPILGAALIIGLLIGIFQTVTQIQEMTLVFVPKISLVGLVIFLLLPWFLEKLMGFTLEIFQQITLMTQ